MTDLKRFPMSITPIGGWGQSQAREGIAVPVDRSVPCCPRCHSSDWKAASLLYREGISISRGRIKGAAIGIGRTGVWGGQTSVIGGAIRGKTFGTSQTMLSQMAAPPKRRRGIRIILGVLVILFGCGAVVNVVGGNIDQGSILAGLVAVCLLVAFLRVRQSHQRDYDEAVEAYESMRMCQRCGTFYEASW
jgi:hypothetical protein